MATDAGTRPLSDIVSPYHGLRMSHGDIDMSWERLWCGWIALSVSGTLNGQVPQSFLAPVDELGEGRIRVRLAAAYCSSFLADLITMAFPSVRGESEDIDSAICEMEADGCYAISLRGDVAVISDCLDSIGAPQANLVLSTDGPYAEDIRIVLTGLCQKVLALGDSDRKTTIEGILSFFDIYAEEEDDPEAYAREREHVVDIITYVASQDAS